MAATQLLQKFILAPFRLTLLAVGVWNQQFITQGLLDLPSMAPAWPWVPHQPMLVLSYDSLFKAVKVNAGVKFVIAAASLKSSWPTSVFGISQTGGKCKEITRDFCSGLCCAFQLPASAWWSLLEADTFSMASENYCKRIFTFSHLSGTGFISSLNSLVFVLLS